MNQIEQFSKLPYSHHAYGIESPHSLREMVKSNIPLESCSYIFDKTYDSFKIDDAREVKQLQSEKTEDASVFILEFSIINNEAQNALLKVLEEPAANTYFILIFPNTRYLLPTLQSRLSLVRSDMSQKSDEKSRLDFTSFFNMNLQERLAFIKQITDKKQDPLLKKSEVGAFLNEAETYYSKKTDKSKHDIAIMEGIFNSRNYLQAKGASNKMILENLALQIEKD